MKKALCEFQLIGGLGNQLFIVLAATQHMLSGHPTVINTGNLNRYGKSHGNSVEQMKFTFQTPMFIDKHANLESFHFRLSTFLMRKFKLKKMGCWQIETDLGYSDISHQNSTKGIKHLGYFQSPRFLSTDLKSKIASMEPLISSKKFEELVVEAKKCSPVMIHIRRGDYLLHTNDLGVLSLEYYENAFARIKLLKQEIGETWIFAADSKLGVELGNRLGVPYRVISPELEITDVESLVLMKYGSAHVIANSTYSWWGAFISTSSEFIITPKPWFKNRPTPNELIPINWVEEPSLWI